MASLQDHLCHAVRRLPGVVTLTRACPDTATPCFRNSGPFLEPSFLPLPSNRASSKPHRPRGIPKGLEESSSAWDPKRQQTMSHPANPIFPGFCEDSHTMCFLFFGLGSRRCKTAICVQTPGDICRMWSVALCRPQRSIWVSDCWCRCTSTGSVCPRALEGPTPQGLQGRSRRRGGG